MSDLGTIAYLTLEPGNSTNEEQISFTGLTQNANGTCTLSGVSSVGFVYPYTSTSGLAKTHAGATTAVLSNTAAFYNEFVNKNTDGTVTSLITFSSANIPTQDSYKAPTLAAQFAPKKYVDDTAVAGAPNADTTTKGIVQIATQAQVDAKTILGSTSAYLMQSLDTQRSTLLSDYVADTSASPNVITIAPSPAITAYTTGQTFSFKLANTNTSPTVTLNVNGLGAKTVIRASGSSPAIGDLASGQMMIVEYNSPYMQIVSPVSTTVAPGGTPTTGDLVYYGGTSGWVRLAAGASPYVLTSNGPGVAPSWTALPSYSMAGTWNATFTNVVIYDNSTGWDVSAYSSPTQLVSVTFPSTMPTTTFTVYSRAVANTSSTVHVRIYKNGVAYGTDHSSANTATPANFGDSLSFTGGDQMQLYGYRSAGAQSVSVSEWAIGMVPVPTMFIPT